MLAVIGEQQRCVQVCQAVLRRDRAQHADAPPRLGESSAFHAARMTLELLGKHDEATSAFRAAVRLDPSQAENRRALGQALANAGRRAPAIEQLTAAVRLDPDNGHALLDLSEAQRTRRA